MIASFPWTYALLAGLVINVGDVGFTLLFAARPWEAELRRQGLTPSKWTPPYYVLVNFLGGAALTYIYTVFTQAGAASVLTALTASLLVWFVTRIYGGGHVVMGQMPLRIFSVMSLGLLVGYVCGGQVLHFLMNS